VNITEQLTEIDVYYGDWVVAHEHRAHLLEIITADREVLQEIADAYPGLSPLSTHHMMSRMAGKRLDE